MRGACRTAATLKLFLPVGALLASAHGVLADSPSPLAFTVRLSFTPEAVRRLESTGEGIVLDAYWYGDPTPAHHGQADQVGQIVVGKEKRVLPPTARTLRITGWAAHPERLTWLVDRKAYVNVNVYSARRTSPDNILDCTFFDDVLEKAKPGIALRCGLLPIPPHRSP